MNRFEQHLSVPFWLVALCLAVCFAGIFDRDLWTPDEPRDAAVALEMGEGGAWVVPRLAGEPFIEKPPLYFAVAGFLARTIGPWIGKVGAIRMSSALWGVGTLLALYLSARRLCGRETALASLVILTTMAGFVESMHWIRVDAALVFFTTAATWCMIEVYYGGRGWLSVPAGAFAAGAFLSKGIIGPLFVGVIWLGVLLSSMLRSRQRMDRIRFHTLAQVNAAFVCLLIAGAWMVLLRRQQHGELWHEWFWVNHVGRLTGETVHLGHIHKGKPFYYLGTLAVFSLPWLPMIPLWIWRAARDAWKKGGSWIDRITPDRFLIFWWGVGLLVLLSCSATKRDVYLAPALPAFALMSAEVFVDRWPKWMKGYFAIWIGLCGVSLPLLALFPLAAFVLPDAWTASLPAILTSFGARHAFVLLLSIGFLSLFHRRWRPAFPIRVTAAIALWYIGALTLAGKAVDSEKSMRTEFERFAGQIPAERRSTMAGWKLSETQRGGLYFYGGIRIESVESIDRLNAILRGTDPHFDSVIISGEQATPELAGFSYRVMAEAQPGARNRKRPLYWIAGAGKGP